MSAAIELDTLKFLEAEIRDHLARGEFVLVVDFADAIIEANQPPPSEAELDLGVVTDGTVDRNSTAYRELAQGLLRARLEAVQRMIERCQGEWGGEPTDPLLKPLPATPVVSEPSAEREPPAAKPALPPTHELLARFFREKGELSDKYIREFHDSLEWLEEFYPDKGLADLTAEDIVAYKDALVETPTNYRKFYKGMTIREAIEKNKSDRRPTLSVASINNKRLGNLDSFFEWCVHNKILASNPAKGIRVRASMKTKTRRKRDPFSLEELNAIFSAPLFTGCKSSRQWKEPGNYLIRDHRYWLPLLALWTGARQGELAQLHSGDIRQVEGIWCIDICETADDDENLDPALVKHLKNEASQRLVPIHSELEKLGFLDYVEAQRRAGHVRLFPDCKKGGDGSYSPFSKLFGRFLESLGIKKKTRTVFHSFRHTVQDATRAAGLTDSVQDALLGRTDDHSRGDYGAGYRPPRLKEEIEKINYNGLILPMPLPNENYN